MGGSRRQSVLVSAGLLHHVSDFRCSEPGPHDKACSLVQLFVAGEHAGAGLAAGELALGEVRCSNIGSLVTKTLKIVHRREFLVSSK